MHKIGKLLKMMNMILQHGEDLGTRLHSSWGRTSDQGEASRGGWHGWRVDDLATRGRARKADAAAADASRLGRRGCRIHRCPHPYRLRLRNCLPNQRYNMDNHSGITMSCTLKWCHSLSFVCISTISAEVSERCRVCKGLALYLSIVNLSAVANPAGA